MAVLAGWDPTPSAQGAVAASRPTDSRSPLPDATPPAAVSAAPAPAPTSTTPAVPPATASTPVPAAAPASASHAPARASGARVARATAAHAPAPAVDGAAAHAVGSTGVPAVRASSPVAATSGPREARAAASVARGGRTVAVAFGVRGALALAPTSLDLLPDTEWDALPGAGSGALPGAGSDVRPAAGSGVGPGLLLPAGPRAPRRLPRDRRPVDPAPVPTRRPTVASCEETYARRRFVALLGVAAASAAAVIGLGLLAASTGGDGVPDRTAITEVRGGETLWDIASRVAPDSPRQAVVERIRLLNGMEGSTLHPGQPLVVPTPG